MRYGLGLGLGLSLMLRGVSAAASGDVTAPTLSSAVINAAGTTLTLTYNEALDTGSTPAAGDYSLAGTARTVASCNVTGSTVVLTLSGVIGIGVSVTVSYTAGASPVQDVAGNDAGNLVAQAVTNNSTQDVTVPTLSSAAINAAGTSLTLTYNEALDTGSTPATGAFSLAGTTRTVTGVNVTGSTVVLTLSAAVAQGATVTVSYTAGASPIQDVAGNDAANLTNQAVTNNSTSDQTVPTLSSAVINAAGTSLTLTYNEALDTGSVPALAAFSISGTILAALTGTPNVTGSTVVLTLSPGVLATETGITLNYTAGGAPIQDVAGNDAANLSARAVTNNSTRVYSPADEGSLVFWGDMSDGTTFTQAAGVVTARSNKVSAVAMTPTGSPAYQATGLNSLPTVDYNGTSQYFLGTEAAPLAAGTNSAAKSIFVVGAFDVVNRLDALFAWGNSANAANGSTWFGKTTTSSGRMIATFTNDSGSLVSVVGTSAPNTSAHVYSFIHAGTTIEGKIDNVTDIASSAFNPTTLTPNRWAINARPVLTPDRIRDGRQSEELIYSVALSSAAQTRVCNYLKAKWGTP